MLVKGKIGCDVLEVFDVHFLIPKNVGKVWTMLGLSY
jgi:hypothetical protein